MTKRSRERAQFLADVLTTAVEGGIGYWSAVSEYRWDLEDPADTSVVVHEYDDDLGINGDYKEEGVRVDLDLIAKGIGILKRSGGVGSAFQSDYWKQFLLADRTNGEDGDYDAGTADCIVQAGMFGEVVYG